MTFLALIFPQHRHFMSWKSRNGQLIVDFPDVFCRFNKKWLPAFLTPLDSRGTTVLRYRTGDLIDGGLVHGPCPHCGRTCPRLVGNISRVSDFKRLKLGKVKGTLVNLGALEHVLDDTPGLGAWQIELRKHNSDPLETDELVVHAVALDGAPSESLSALIRKNLRNATELSPNAIEFHSWKEMSDLQGVGVALKEEKFIDRRTTQSAPEPTAH